MFGSTHDLSYMQRIQNYSARVILRFPKSSSTTTHLKSLHWFLVKVRSTYKIACFCYHSSTAPSYVTDILQKKPLPTRNTRSSSHTMPLRNRPTHKLTPAHPPCHFSIDLHRARQHMVFARFLLSGPLFQMMMGRGGSLGINELLADGSLYVVPFYVLLT